MTQNYFEIQNQNKLLRKITLIWLALALVLFLLPVIFGLLMRSIQANILPDPNHLFYNYLTAHGLLMVGIWVTTALALLSFTMSKYVVPSAKLIIISVILIVVGALMLLWAIFIGDMAIGWYFLYPLPMRLGTLAGRIVFFSSIGVLGVGWLLWSIAIFLAIAKKYTFAQTLGWHYIIKKEDVYVPPMIMIAAVSLLAIIICLLIAVILLLLYLLEFLTPVANDALLMKNLTFVFGHTIVNMNLYLVIALVYEYFPQYGDGEFKNNRMLALAWNSVLLVVMFAYFHHLYMDFAQPDAIQYIGQFASYGAGLVAAVFTIFSVLAFVYTHKMKWNFSSILIYIAVSMWTVGGIAAVIDATIPVNFRMHNTLWVPAHFHSYYFTGAVMMMLAFMWAISLEVDSAEEKPWIKKVLLPVMFIGGFGVVLMFYFGGTSSIPRRYAVYPPELHSGTVYAAIAVGFILLFLAGYLILAGILAKRFMNGLRK
ncbi:MAG: cbb3-type cytochrome c oxidase subunit I [Bacteroidetes bacterium]|nr:cbb3-type cytochrome c oxidase subunit I [Bacteroidota bacterium]